MTVKELIEKLSVLPGDAIVYIDWDTEGGNETEASDVIDFEGWDKGWAPNINSVKIV